MAQGMLEGKESEFIRNVYTQGMKQTASLFSTLLNNKIQILLQELKIVPLQEIINSYGIAQMSVKVNIANDVKGQGVMLFPHRLAWALCDILKGNDGKSPAAQMGTEETAIFTQTIEQFLNFLSTSLSQTLNKKTVFSNTGVKFLNTPSELTALMGAWGVPNAALLVMRMNIENVTEDQFVQVLPLSIVEEIIGKSKGKGGKVNQNVEPLNLLPLDESGKPQNPGLGNILIDIPLQLSVELGRTRMILKELLELGVGSIIELDRLAGEPVDIMLNNKLLAKGEVVVIDEKLGVRVTHIVDTNERV